MYFSFRFTSLDWFPVYDTLFFPYDSQKTKNQENEDLSTQLREELVEAVSSWGVAFSFTPLNGYLLQHSSLTTKFKQRLITFSR